ncbi:Leucine-rich repeat receptor protein kinase EMS1-like protein [Drosera capensis]
MLPFLQATIAAVGTFLLVSLLILLFLLLRRHRSHHTLASPPPILADSVAESASFDSILRRVSMQELVRATNNFDPSFVIGDGSFGLVYRAELVSSASYSVSVVALKKLDPNAFQGQREFRAEMETLGKLRHRNLARILGYCVSGADRVLIYEYIEKGSLDQWLHDDDGDRHSGVEGSPSRLDWDTRVRIVKGVAEGLAFLHGLESPIVHRDIKASNVLLDAGFEARIADFGLARLIEESHSHVSTQVAGTMGYMPPEYKAGLSAATVKADVYSFGVLMFEVASGRRPSWPFRDEEGDDQEVWLVEWAKKKVAEGKSVEILDREMRAREEVIERAAAEVAEFARVADLCTREKPRERPAMAEALEMLKGISCTTSECVIKVYN